MFDQINSFSVRIIVCEEIVREVVEISKLTEHLIDLPLDRFQRTIAFTKIISSNKHIIPSNKKVTKLKIFDQTINILSKQQTSHSITLSQQYFVISMLSSYDDNHNNLKIAKPTATGSDVVSTAGSTGSGGTDSTTGSSTGASTSSTAGSSTESNSGSSEISRSFWEASAVGQVAL